MCSRGIIENNKLVYKTSWELPAFKAAQTKEEHHKQADFELLLQPTNCSPIQSVASCGSTDQYFLQCTAKDPGIWDQQD